MGRSAVISLLALLLVASPAVATETAPASAEQQAEHTPTEKGAYAAFGIGAAAFAGSVAAGIYALHLRLGLEQVCQPRDNCPLSAQPNIDAMNEAALASTIVGAVGLAAMATGTVLILVSKKQTQQTEVSVSPAAVSLRLRF